MWLKRILVWIYVGKWKFYLVDGPFFKAIVLFIIPSFMIRSKNSWFCKQTSAACRVQIFLKKS